MVLLFVPSMLRLVVNAILAVVRVGIVYFRVNGRQEMQLLGVSTALQVQSVVRELLANVGALSRSFRLRLVVLMKGKQSNEHCRESAVGVDRFPARMRGTRNICNVVRVVVVVLRKLGE